MGLRQMGHGAFCLPLPCFAIQSCQYMGDETDLDKSTPPPPSSHSRTMMHALQ